MFFLVRLLDNPGDELFGLLSGFGKQFERNHVEHLDGLIELCVHPFEVHHPKHCKAQACQYYVDVEHDGIETDGA